MLQIGKFSIQLGVPIAVGRMGLFENAGRELLFLGFTVGFWFFGICISRKKESK